jgi:hypothetical protein
MTAEPLPGNDAPSPRSCHPPLRALETVPSRRHARTPPHNDDKLTVHARRRRREGCGHAGATDLEPLWPHGDADDMPRPANESC